MIMGYGVEKAAWLDALYREKFFVGCSYHENAKKNEKNVCCLDCCTSICPHCLPSHRFHRLLQVRRYVYHDVVRLEDLQKLIDCSNVQAYTINSAKVVFIKKRPQNRQFKGSGNYCTSCDRSLQEPFIHCSLACKVDFVLKQYKDLSPYLRACNTLQLSPDFLIPQDMAMGDQDEIMTHSTIVDSDEPMSSNSSSISSGSDHNNNMIITSSIIMHNNNNNSSYNSKGNNNIVVRKKRSSGWSVCARIMANSNNNNNKVSDEDIATNISRRKGIPHRSPFC